MPPAELLKLLRRQPFVPFRIHLSDGITYEIKHPDLVLVGLASATVGFPAASDPRLYDRSEIVALRQIVRLEPLEQAAASP
ncbi:MAG TPA: hypothetical protein VMS17_24725 [Gemmataceae bacterium]|nr:hypothetical protein [Gemmataceae bacterium]